MNLFSLPSPAYISPYLTAVRVGESSIMICVSAPSNTVLNRFSVIEKNNLVDSFQKIIQANKPLWLNDLVLAYECLLVEYNDQLINHFQLVQCLQGFYLDHTSKTNGVNITKTFVDSYTHDIPVCYDYEAPEYPHDRKQVLDYTGLSLSKLISIHSENRYRIFAVGFMPNFAYLGELDERLHLPRLVNPRLKVPAGAVAIADNQTAVYPSNSPGGWHVIGYTPIALLNHPDIVFVAGQHVRFVPINRDEFDKRKLDISSKTENSRIRTQVDKAHVRSHQVNKIA